MKSCVQNPSFAAIMVWSPTATTINYATEVKHSNFCCAFWPKENQPVPTAATAAMCPFSIVLLCFVDSSLTLHPLLWLSDGLAACIQMNHSSPLCFTSGQKVPYTRPCPR